METMFGNLAFALVVKTGSAAVGLALFLWFVWWLMRRSKAMPKGYRKHVRLGMVGLWVAIVALSAGSVIMSNTPRITVDDHGARAPAYSTGTGIQNLDPTRDKTYEDRVRETRELGRENLRETPGG